ncbi:peptidase inhibitor family I36 protein [Allokutzneria albata]|uniref:Peptidase inhibitor family I36 n=1 Tax=Allokutzneria albata TaxID=211114 RepID=A0A1G9WY30_ALLAB|nr:peptidase inhibitor family I36 protein [Allokutzneria albata]SDM89367.1 hypothetical protein SAMN04489726_3877 [Allokutzneria albata]
MFEGRVRRAAVAVLVVAGTMLAGVAPASAKAKNDCRNDICMWEDANYVGDRYVDEPMIAGCREIPGWNGDNEISSVWNRSGRLIYLYSEDNCQGRAYAVGSGAELASLSDFNDDAESYLVT